MEDRLRILVVDDEAIVGAQLKPSLEKVGYEVEAFQDGGAALERFAEQPFDIVVTDVRMDDVDGLEVLERVLALATPKVILITGYATVELAREALTKGAYDFIAKPFKIGDLKAIVERAATELRSR